VIENFESYERHAGCSRAPTAGLTIASLKEETMNELQGLPGAEAPKTLKAVYTIVKRPGMEKSLWVRIGTAFVNRDCSLNVKLDASPTNGELHIRDIDPAGSFPRRHSDGGLT
jgi:hypothetical protein